MSNLDQIREAGARLQAARIRLTELERTAETGDTGATVALHRWHDVIEGIADEIRALKGAPAFASGPTDAPAGST